MYWIRRKLIAYLLRSFQKDIRNFKGALSKKEEDLMLSALWQNQSFRNYLVARESAMIIQMANAGKPPSDEEYGILYGRRLELVALYTTARLAHMREQDALAKAQKKPESSQV